MFKFSNKSSPLLDFFTHNLLFIILCSFLAVAYFFSRIINLTLIPVFVDEAIYIRWAQVMRAVASLRFLPLSDGKQPLFMWLIIPFLKALPDPLLAGRMVSLLAGFGTMMGVFVLSFILFKKKEISFLASLLYLISPFTLFFDRMALVDGLLSFFGIWIFICLILLVKQPRLDLAIISGILLGLGLITKSPALFFALFAPSTMILFSFGKGKRLFFLKILGFWLIVGLFGWAIYNILRLGPEFHMIAIRNKDYLFSISEVLRHPLDPFWGNFKNGLSWFWILLTPFTFGVGVLGGILALRKHFKESLLLWGWILVPFLGQSAVAKVYTSRYILFVVPLFLVFAGFTLEIFFRRTKGKWLVVGGLMLVFLLPVYQSILLLTDPQRAWLPPNERSGYLEGWTAGYGIKQSAAYLKAVAKNQKVLVGTEGYFGTLPDGLQIYLEKVPNTTVIGVGYPIKEIPQSLLNGLKENRVFLVANDSRFQIVNQESLRLINSYPKAPNPVTGKQENLLFFEILR